MNRTCLLLALVLLLVAPVRAATAAAADDDSPDLFGTVLSDDGTPISKATVFIYTAGPKKGTASICPSCYPDCRKKAQTNGDGQFRIESLDPKLLFRLLVVAAGHQARFVPNVNPERGTKEITLQSLDPDALRSKTRIGGLILGPDGLPVVGAVLNVEGLERGTSTRWGGNGNDADPVAVADDRGRFSMACVEGVTGVHAMAEGRGVAKRWVRLTPGRDHLVRMAEGVTVTGRLMRDAKPVQDAVVGLITTERAAGECLHDFETTTSENGRFALTCVTPEKSYYLFARMDSMRGQGVLPVKSITAGKTETTLDVGDLPVLRANRVAGHIVLTDGEPIPPDTRLFLGREQAWDHSEAPLGENGEFEFSAVPSESVTLHVRIQGYKFSKRNPSLDWLNGSIIGRVDKDISDLMLVMEPGQWRFNRGEEEDMPPDAERQPRDKPLRGVSPGNESQQRGTQAKPSQ